MTIQSTTEPYLEKYMKGSKGSYYYNVRNFAEQGLLNESKNPIENRQYPFVFSQPYDKTGRVI